MTLRNARFGNYGTPSSSRCRHCNLRETKEVCRAGCGKRKQQISNPFKNKHESKKEHTMKNSIKTKHLLTTTQDGARRILMGLVVTVAIFLRHNAMAIPATVDLGTASGFAVLAGSGITIAGAVNTTTITGDIGTYPTPSVTGLGNVVLNGVNQTADTGLMLNAQNGLTAAFTDAAGRPVNTYYAPISDLGGLTLVPGVYNDPTSFGLTGTLTLDAQGNPDAVFIIQAGSTLITASDSSVVLENGAQACHVFWVVGSSATLGTGTDFMGNILADQSITLDTGATVDGRLLAENGAVTLDNNTITESICNAGSSVPDGGSTALLLGFGVMGLLALLNLTHASAKSGFNPL
jgi:Ice-binding-like